MWCAGCDELMEYMRCMRLARSGVGGEVGECMRGLGLGFTNHVGIAGVLDVCLCFGCGGVDPGGVGG